MQRCPEYKTLKRYVLVSALQSLISCESGVMVESPTYYNAFRPVLSRLQTLSEWNFPFASEILLRSTLPNPSSIGFEFDKDCLTRTMDDSQSNAAAASLETRFSLIQGPPGCGKTFVAKEIVKMMMHCRDFRRFDYWDLGNNYDIFEEFESEDSEEAELREYLSFRGRGPILVMTYKNHALDSFLENCLEFTNSIVRIGGRTTSKAIEEYNLHNLYKEARFYFPKDKFLRLQEARSTLRSLAREIEMIAKESFVGIKASDLLRFLLKREVGKQQIHSLIAKNFEESYGLVIKQDVKYSLPEEVEEAVKEILTCHSTLAGKLLKDALHRWLSESESTEFLPKPQSSLFVKPTKIKKKIDKEKEGEETENMALDEDELKEQIAERVIGRESELEFKTISENSTNSIYNNLQKRLAYLEPDERESDVREFRDVWTLSPEGRYILLSYWLRECRKKNEQKLSIVLKEYNRFYQQVQELEDGRNVAFLRSRSIVACTITGACLRMGVISKVAPSVAIVEEAAEILESQLIAALPSSVRHVVLIGDHKQLPPQVHNYRLAKKFGLGVSIFERLANNNYPVSQLQFHRRGPQLLCPLFSKFYTQDIVALKEDPKPPPALAELGLMYWWSHNAPARNCQNGTSFENEFEAAMIVGAVRLLTWLGKIEASQISIVTGYLGQAKKIKQLLVKENVYGVTVSTIDEIQGDENDFIFLSLTRSFSNEDLGQQSLGFLASPNRQCVALSRARIGLYIFGSSTLFETDTSWKNTLDYFRSKDKLGTELRFNIYDKVLTFEHPNDFTLLFKKWETENEQMKLKVQEEFLKELPPENYDGVHDVTEEFGKKIEKLMNKSVLDKRDLGQGRDADGKKFKSFKVRKVKIVFNTNMYLFYLHNQKVIEESRPPPLGFRVDSNADWQVLKDYLNEVYLFHGTKPELVDVITNSGFDERVSNLGGMYGAGIYFAENADKSDQYAVADSNNIRYMFLSKVVLGNPYKTQKIGQWRRPPEIDPADPTKLYDSIIAVSGRKGFAGSAVHRHQEFVVFDRYRCLPEFVIEYIRQ